MIHIKEIINNKKYMSNNTKCPQCKGEAVRVLEEGRYYLRCYECGANTIAKTVSAMKQELEDIYGDN